MESNYEEADQSDQESHNLGVGRSYECVFCKRGFTTAQALGGHMNIHRKDRAKSKPPPASSNKHEVNYHGPRFFQPILSYPPHYAAPNEAQLSYQTFFPASTSSARQFYGNNYHDNLQDGDQKHFDPFGDDCRMSLSLQYCPTLVEDMQKKAPVERRENDLDLELRLGPHDP